MGAIWENHDMAKGDITWSETLAGIKTDWPQRS